MIEKIIKRLIIFKISSFLVIKLINIIKVTGIIIIRGNAFKKSLKLPYINDTDAT